MGRLPGGDGGLVCPLPQPGGPVPVIQICAPVPSPSKAGQPHPPASPCATGTCSEVISLLACTIEAPSFGQLAAHRPFLCGPGLVPSPGPEVDRALFLCSRHSEGIRDSAKVSACRAAVTVPWPSSVGGCRQGYRFYPVQQPCELSLPPFTDEGSAARNPPGLRGSVAGGVWPRASLHHSVSPCPPVPSEWKQATRAQRSEGLGQSRRAAELQPLKGMPDVLSTHELCPQVTTQSPS